MDPYDDGDLHVLARNDQSRADKREAIWNHTPEDDRGRARPGWPAKDRGKRTILIDGGGLGNLLVLPDELSDEQIADRLGDVRTDAAIAGGIDADPA